MRTATCPTTIRLPRNLCDKLTERARAERRTLSAMTRLLLEDGLANGTPFIDEDEIERLAQLARESLSERRIA